MSHVLDSMYDAENTKADSLLFWEVGEWAQTDDSILK